MDDRMLARTAVKLLRAGVAPRHVRRCMEELRAHRLDLIAHLREQGVEEEAANAEADTRLGSPDDFIAATLARPELRSWSSRAPWLVFAVLPVFAFVAIGVALISLVIGYLEVVQPHGRAVTDLGVWRAGAFALAVLVKWLLPLGLCSTLFFVAWRARSRALWPSVGALLVAVLGALLTLHMVAPEGNGQAQLSVGAGYPPAELGRAALLIVVALCVVAVIHWRERSSEVAELRD